MNAKEYFSQVFDQDIKINMKLEELDELRSLALKCTSVSSGLPRSHDPMKRSVTDPLDRIIDLQQEINDDIDRLVDLKREIREVIRRVPDSDARIILEARYFCGKSWPEIAKMTYHSLRWVQTLHVRALAAAEPYIPCTGREDGE